MCWPMCSCLNMLMRKNWNAPQTLQAGRALKHLNIHKWYSESEASKLFAFHVEKIIITAVLCCYKAVSFLPNPHSRHSINCTWGWGMGCLLWVQALSLHLSHCSAFLHDRPWISPWIKSISNELDITIHMIASKLSSHCDVIANWLWRHQ